MFPEVQFSKYLPLTLSQKATEGYVPPKQINKKEEDTRSTKQGIQYKTEAKLRVKENPKPTIM